MSLESYRKKRDFSRTPEPAGAPKPARRKTAAAAGGLSFVIQKHAASRLHYDFRLELDGVLKSWAVPKGPSLDPQEKRLAVHVEDHPIEYGGFEGVIPKGEYGGGTVQLWDRGTWSSLEGEPAAAYASGKLKIELHGDKLRGGWMLVRMTGPRAGERQENWLLIKERDATACPGSGDAVVRDEVASVASGQTIEEIAADPPRVWESNGATELPTRAAAAAALAELARGLPGARQAAMPRQIEPELATAALAPPAGDRWLHEIKYDGYRVLCEVEGGRARLWTRSGKDWTHRFPALAAAAAALPVESALLDGEATVVLPDGRTSFEALQQALGDGAVWKAGSRGAGGSSAAKREAGGAGAASGRGSAMVYFAFDLLYLEGCDIREAPLLARKDALRQLIAAAAPADAPDRLIRWSDHVVGQGKGFFEQACSYGLEGTVAKRADRPYRSGRGQDWLKVKCLLRQELVVGGFTNPAGTRAGFGALLVGVYEGEDLRYAGRVGTGFSQAQLIEMRRRLDRIERKTPPFANPPRGAEARGAHWLEPRLVAEVAFAEWTRDGVLRQPAFLGLREDKDPREVHRERPAPPPAPDEPPAAAAAPRAPKAPAKLKRPKAPAKSKLPKAPAKSKPPKAPAGSKPPKAPAPKPPKAPAPKPPAAPPKAPAAGRRGAGETELAGVRLTHPDRVVFPAKGLTKLDLAHYYESVADLILPHLAGRPLTLVRCPAGQGGKCFYQKHVTEQFPDSVRRVEVEEGGETVLYGVVDSLAGLIALVQMSVLELHVWGAHEDQIERPDYLVFDLDPDEGLPWERVVDAARGMRSVLADSDLRSFLKTTGGKGLHVVVPLERRHTWDEVKEFTHAVAEGVATARPDLYTANPLKARRKGRIYIDYLRNARGATSIAAYSCRARAGAGVSAPLDWGELATGVRADTWTVENFPERLRKLTADPWQEMGAVRQWLTAALKRRWGLSGGS
jgi:bifunctional non-homologous end joining protein LigD